MYSIGLGLSIYRVYLSWWKY